VQLTKAIETPAEKRIRNNGKMSQREQISQTSSLFCPIKIKWVKNHDLKFWPIVN